MLAHATTFPTVTLAEVRALVADAARIVPPVWPLDGAIAVNPLAGLEHLPFEEAVRTGAELFGARAALPIADWRRLVADGRLDRDAVRDAAIERLGGYERAFWILGPNVTRLDALLARLFDLPERDAAAALPDPAALLAAKWCALFFDAGVAAAPMPGRAKGLYRAVLALLPYDGEFAKLGGRFADALFASAPADPEVAIATALADLDPPARRETLERLLARLPGWAGHLRWRTEHAEPEVAVGAPAGTADLLALMLLCDRAAGTPARLVAERADPAACATALAMQLGLDPDKAAPLLGDIAALDDADLGMVFQVAAERSFRDTLVKKLTTQIAPAPFRPAAQLLFCIDVRSEPFRRALEAQGRFETLGYAGFFGLPIAIQTPNRARLRQAPVLIAPPLDLAMVPAPGSEPLIAAERRAATGRDLFGRLKAGTASAFATAEATGPLAGVAMLARTLAPRFAKDLTERDAPCLVPSLDKLPGATGLPPEERVGYARALFAMTGLPHATARLVVLVGHRGEATNNPYAAALDCGACAGHRGAPNAQAMAAVLNDPAVRQAMADDGEPVPADTWFVAAEHNTTTDAIELFGLGDMPATHAEDVARLQHAFAAAGTANRARRAVTLGRPADDLATGAAHWGEVRAEWGLAGAAAFIVGPRSVTADADLEGRAFLHSYDWQTDKTGEALATILTAPMVVAQWITCQYLFSTIDNMRYGAGDKTIHNPVGRIGVVRGNGGDLCVGLPRQSLFADDGTPYHMPQRLLTVVHAPLDLLDRVVQEHDVLRRLFGNGWVQLVAIEPASGKVRRWTPDAELARPAARVPINDMQTNLPQGAIA